MNVWVLLIAIFLLIVPGLVLVIIGGIEKFGNKKKNEIYIVLFIAGWIFLLFGIIMLIYAYMSSKKKIDSEASYYMNMQMQYMNYMNYLSSQNRMMQNKIIEQSNEIQSLQTNINKMADKIRDYYFENLTRINQNRNTYSPPVLNSEYTTLSSLNTPPQNTSSLNYIRSPAVPIPTEDIYG